MGHEILHDLEDFIAVVPQEKLSLTGVNLHRDVQLALYARPSGEDLIVAIEFNDTEGIIGANNPARFDFEEPLHGRGLVSRAIYNKAVLLEDLVKPNRVDTLEGALNYAILERLVELTIVRKGDKVKVEAYFSIGKELHLELDYEVIEPFEKGVRHSL